MHRRRDARDLGRRHPGAPVRARPAPARRTGRGRPCSTATAASTSRSPRRTPRRRWPGSRPAGCGRWPTCAAAPSTARSGTAPACASASRTCSTTSPPPASTWSRDGLDDARRSSASWAARTAACWSAPRSPSGPTCSPPSSAARRCWTWSATSCSASAAPGTTSTAPPRTRPSSAGCSATRRTTRVREGTAYPAVLFTTFESTPGSTRCTPASCARRCSTRPPARGRCCCAGRRTSATARARSAGPSPSSVDQLAFLGRAPGAAAVSATEDAVRPAAGRSASSSRTTATRSSSSRCTSS